MDLWTAVEANDAEMVASLLRAGAEPNEVRGNRHLLDVVPDRADEIKALLIEAGAWSPQRGRDIVWAANLGRPAVVQALLDRGADPNVESSMGRPLFVAARRGDEESVRILLQKGADPDVRGVTNTALSAAIEHPKVLLLLLAHGAAPDLEPRHGGPRALHLAAARGDLALVRALVEAGADVNFRARSIPLPGSSAGLDALKTLFSAGAAGIGGGIRTWKSDNRSLAPAAAHQTSALCLASRLGHDQVVEYLLEAGADPQARDGEGFTARQWAERNGHQAVLQKLQAIVEVDNPSLQLLQAALQGDLQAAVQALDAGADLHARDERQAWRGCTPLLLAAESGTAELVVLLLERGADPGAHDGEGQKPDWNHREGTAEQLRGTGVPLGRTALHRAAAAGHTQLVRCLTRSGLPAKDFFGDTALAVALRAGHIATARDLLHIGATPGHAELMAALESGDFSLLPGLLASVKPQRDALLEACAWGDAEVVRLLLRHGADARRPLKNKGPLAHAVSASQYVTAENPQGVGRKAPIGASTLAPLPETRILAVVEALLEAGADPEAPGYLGTPLEHGISSGYVAVAERLIAAGARVTPAMVAAAEQHGQFALAATLARSVQTAVPVSPKSRGSQDRRGPEVPVPVFSAGPQFAEVLGELGEICGSPPVAMETLPGAYRLHLRTSREADVEALQQKFLGAGALVLQTDVLSKQDWAVYPTTDPFAVVAAWQTNGSNVGVGTGYIIEWLRQLDAQCPLRFITVSADTIEARFLGELPPVARLAKEISQFCPDVVTQGVGTVKRLAHELAATKRLYLWWD